MPSDRDLFQSAIDIPDAVARAEYLVAKADEPEQRARIERLLAAHAAAGGFLEQPPEEGDFAVTRTAGDSTRAAEAPVGQPGTVIAGKYKLLQQIGEGGMGTVWMADQTEPIKRRVAVKLIRVDRGNSATILARFEAERQAIALMDHPHIAKLLDAGVTGEPGGVSRRVSDDDTRRLTPLGSPAPILPVTMPRWKLPFPSRTRPISTWGRW